MSPDDGRVTCPTCQGRGILLRPWRRCSDCGGPGTVWPSERARIIRELVEQRQRER